MVKDEAIIKAHKFPKLLSPENDTPNHGAPFLSIYVCVLDLYLQTIFFTNNSFWLIVQLCHSLCDFIVLFGFGAIAAIAFGERI